MVNFTLPARLLAEAVFPAFEFLEPRWLHRRIIYREDVPAICQDRGFYFDHLSDRETVKIDLPRSVSDIPEATIRSRYPEEMHIDPPFVCELEDVELVGPQAITVFDGKYVLENSLDFQKRLVNSATKSLFEWTFPGPSISGRYDEKYDTAVALTGPWARGYYHWFSEYIPRLEGVEHYVESTGETPVLIIPSDPPSWMTESLHMMGYGSDDYREWTSSRAKVERLVLPSVRCESRQQGHGTRRTLFSPAAYRWVRERMTESLHEPSEGDGGNRIYISRNDSNRRRVLNDSEVTKLLGRHGFKRYLLAEMEFRDQVELFANADMIVAPHGAGLMNMIYSSDASVLEIMGRGIKDISLENPGTYYLMATGLGFDYYLLECEPVDRGLFSDILSDHRHMHVDQDDLERTVEKMV